MLRVCSDVHGKISKYLNIINDSPCPTLQLGDLDFDYSFLKRSCVDIDRHKMLGGNHDSYDEYPNLVQSGYALGDYGMSNHGDVPFFFVRGAFSIDWQFRQKYDLMHGTTSWWKDEELSFLQMLTCYDEYKAAKPDIIITHDCPLSVSRTISDGRVLRNFGLDPETFETRTGRLLEEMLVFHQPKIWVFGHFHLNVDITINNTRFLCKEELGILDID